MVVELASPVPERQTSSVCLSSGYLNVGLVGTQIEASRMTPENGITLKAALERWSAAELPLASLSFLPELGISLLEAGYDVPEVLKLAICERDEHPEDLRKAAARAFAALGVATETERLHEIVVGRWIAEQLLSGQLAPEDGVCQMARLWVLTCHSERFKEWMYLEGAIRLFRDGYEGLEPFVALTEENIPSTIRGLARQFIESHPLPMEHIVGLVGE